MQEENDLVLTAIDHFFAHFHIGSRLNRAGIRKIRGARPLDIIRALFALPFQRTTLFWRIVRSHSLTFRKDAVYDVLNRPNFNWRTLLLSLAVAVVRFFAQLTSESRESVLILDDTLYKRNRSKSVELLATVYDHCAHACYRGFRCLCLAWSDGVSTAPVDFALLSSSDPQKRYQEASVTVDKRSCGYQRRKEALRPATALLESMVKRAFRAGIRARYILMDSWFAFPAIIAALSAHLPVVCMLKRMKTVHYTWRGQKLTLTGLYQRVRKRRGKARILASVLVSISEGQTVKIVFVRDRRKQDWLALLTTDITLSDAEVVRIYGKRWDIEVFFKMCKQYLQFETGVQVRNFDGMIAHTTMVMMRYLFLSYRQRCETDDRTLGELFVARCDELRDITLLEALHRMVTLVANELRKIELTSEEFIQTIIDTIMGTIIAKFNLTPLSTTNQHAA
jgi:hypothetical protein